MLELFRAELDTHLPVLSRGLLALEKDQPDPKDLEAMMRAAHSIKGAARIVGVDAAVRVAHVMEDCFSAAQAHTIALTSASVDVLLQGVDALQRNCMPQGDPAVPEASIQSLLERIAAIRDNRSSPPPQQVEADPQPALRVQETRHNTSPGDCCVTLPALLDASAAEVLRTEFCGMLERRPARIRIDFSQARQISATGLAMLVSFAREMAQADVATTIDAAGVSPAWAVLLRTTGLDDTFKRSE